MFIASLILVCSITTAKGQKYVPKLVAGNDTNYIAQYISETCELDSIEGLHKDFMDVLCMYYGHESDRLYIVAGSNDRRIVSYNIETNVLDTLILDYGKEGALPFLNNVWYIEDWSADSVLVAGRYWRIFDRVTGEGRTLRTYEDIYEKDDPPHVSDCVRHYGDLICLGREDRIIKVNEELNGVEILLEGIDPLGIATMVNRCGIRKLYVSNKELFELNLADGTLNEICGEHMVFGRGWTDLDPRDTIPCSLTIDLDRNDDNGADLDYTESYCRHTALHIADEDVLVYNENPTDSIVIEIINGSSEQYLEGTASATIQIQNDGSQRLVLVNSGSGFDTDFEDVIKSIRFHDDGLYKEGAIEIVFTSYYDGLKGDPAMAILTVSARSPVAILDQEITVCEGDNLQSTQVWDPRWLYQDEDLYDVKELTFSSLWHEDLLLIIDTTLFCRDTAFVRVNLPEDPNFFMENLVVCPDASLNVSLPEPYVALSWSTGASSATLEVSDQGSYSVLYTDGSVDHGCEWTKDFEISEAPHPVLDTIFLTLENGEVEYNDIVYDQVGQHTLTLGSIIGCDSIITLLSINQEELNLDLPNIVSKSANVEANKYFGINCNDQISYSLIVYDRYGNKMYQNTHDCFSKLDISLTDWTSGVYVYTIEIVNDPNIFIESKRMVGTLTVLD